MALSKEELLKKLAEAKAKREALDAELDADIEEQALEAQIASEERASKDAVAIRDARRKYGPINIAVVKTTHHGAIILKRASEADFKRFQDTLSEKESSSASLEDIAAFVRPSVVYPAFDEYDRILSEIPGVIGELGNQLNELAGVKAKQIAKK